MTATPHQKQTITTIDELATLPVETLTRDSLGALVLIVPAQFARTGATDLLWPLTGKRHAVKYARDFLPLTVLHVGGEQTPADVTEQAMQIIKPRLLDHLVDHDAEDEAWNVANDLAAAGLLATTAPDAEADR